MIDANDDSNTLINRLIDKGSLKNDIYYNTVSIFNLFKETSREIAEEIKKEFANQDVNLRIKYNEPSEFATELVFAGDQMITVMHTNIFQFPREHEVMSTSYIKEDPTRSYCGVIKLYNFLADSFIYNSLDDIGYLIARIFINKEFHYFVEGKRQVGLLYNNFGTAVIDKKAVRKILETAIDYCIHFDLLTPPYDNIKEISVEQMKESIESMRLKTGKRLGFRFQIDHEDQMKELKGRKNNGNSF